MSLDKRKNFNIFTKFYLFIVKLLKYLNMFDMICLNKRYLLCMRIVYNLQAK